MATSLTRSQSFSNYPLTVPQIDPPVWPHLLEQLTDSSGSKSVEYFSSAAHMAHLDSFRSKATLSQTLLGLKYNRNPTPYPNPSYLLTLSQSISTVLTFPYWQGLFCLLLYSQPWYNVHCSCYEQEIPRVLRVPKARGACLSYGRIHSQD